MKTRSLGRTRFQVSEVGFGCWAIGGSGYGPTRDEESLEALETAWRQGVNFFDTADTYGHGHSEKLVAQFLKGKPRERIVVASKAGWDFYHGASRKNFDPDYIRFACEESLKRLEIDAIDVYQLHNPTLEALEKGECLKALEGLKKEGKIRAIGVSIHREEEGLYCIEDGRVDTLQLVFNLLDQRMAEKVMPAAKRAGVGVIVREPLAFGILTGKYAAGHEFAKGDHRRRFPREKMETQLEKFDAMRGLLGNGKVSTTRAALEYVLGFEEVSSVIPGAKTPAQIAENMKASTEPGLDRTAHGRLREAYEREAIFQTNQGF